MAPAFKSFLQRWLINTLAVLVAVYLGRGITYEKPADLFIAALLLGILNAFLRPLMWLLSLPLLILTLGLFTLVINGLMLYFVGYLLQPRFQVETFGAACWGALVISFVSLALNSLTGTGNSRASIKVHRGPPEPPAAPRGGGGPIIDV